MANEMSRERCLEVLGLSGDTSAQELKSAYRDMAKVWHPDRFTHDPRLRQKAQEKLKEINDAYRQMLTGKFTPTRPRPAGDPTRDARTHAAPHAHHTQYATRAERETGVAVRPAPRRIGRLALVPALAFCVTFAAVTPRLLSTRRHAPPPAGEPLAQPSREARAEVAREQPEDAAARKNARKQSAADAARRADSPAATGGAAVTSAPPLRALTTVTVSVDPSTGLLARADCPHKMSMTFPAGDEPRAHCNAAHRAAAESRPPAAEEAAGEKKSRLKSFAGRLASPTKWLGKDSRTEPARRRPGDGNR